MEFLANAQDTARVLRCSLEDAIAFELIAMGAWAEFKRDSKNTARMAIASRFATGGMSRADYDACRELVA